MRVEEQYLEYSPQNMILHIFTKGYIIVVVAALAVVGYSTFNPDDTVGNMPIVGNLLDPEAF